MPLSAIKVQARNNETTVTVQGYQIGSLQGFTIHSSNACEEPINSNWPRSLAHAIEERRRDGGAEKGRLLYAFQLRWLQPDLAVGALAYHLEDRLVRVVSLGMSQAKDSTFASIILGLLLNCAEEIAKQHGCNCLEWAVRNEEAVRSACARFNFRRVRKSDRRQRAVRGVVLVERRFSKR
jgi:hypothetical protein